MSTLKRRQENPENAHAMHLKALRCAARRSWSDLRVVTIDADAPETWQEPTPSTRCTDCGWQPALIRTVEVEDLVRRPGRQRRGDIRHLSGMSNVPTTGGAGRRTLKRTPSAVVRFRAATDDGPRGCDANRGWYPTKGTCPMDKHLVYATMDCP